ncbi:hypothetical protein [Glycomyces dulcitolivorans]|uniref:hypothetical protein n=1 Tax=Glycomyces dulcitolivorans TaxID=2200759 RepID=UPI000DD4EAC0|nr:hypothetical protein [Glycomyces dulcitolivorans]
MDENVPSLDEPIEDAATERSRTSKVWVGLIAVLIVGGVLGGAQIWWSPWGAPAGPACAEDATHMGDHETSLCFSIPTDWVQVEGAKLDGSDYTSIVESDSGNAWVAVEPVPDAVTATETEDAARQMIATLVEVSPDAQGIRIESGPVEGQESTTAEFETTIVWFRVVVVDVDGSLVMMVGSTYTGEDGLREQVEQIQDSLSIA